MPSRALQQCHEAGCTNLVRGARCAEHVRVEPTIKAREKRTDPWYKRKLWRELRAMQLADFPLCEVCKQRGKMVPATEVHHIKARRSHPELALEPDNLQSICKPCHARHELGERRAAQVGRGDQPGGGST